jgi:hypothetical protein
MKTAPHWPDFSKLKFLQPRKDVVYRDNKGYNLHVDYLPWAPQTPFVVRRYRISASQNFDLVDEHVASGNTLDLSNALEPSSVELIVLQRH